jgi:predicted TIM-barrel fold metal-dependent hydrolase
VSRRHLTLLPDPPPQERTFTIISVDDHIIEPADMFTGRVPARLEDQAPAIVELPNGDQVWAYEGALFYDLGLGACAGRPQREWFPDPIRFDEMRPGCWDAHARVKDMDIDGVAAALCFPSMGWGFAGRVFSASKDPALGLASMRAWNLWQLEELAGPYPERFIPLQITWLRDPVIAAAEIRANAALGFKAVSFPDAPHRLGFPPIRDPYWEPLLRACEETQTVICLHTGASGWVVEGSPNASVNVTSCLFPVQAYVATIDWLWAGIPVRYPDIRISLTEGGIGWVPMALDRLDHVMAHSAGSGCAEPWAGDLTPSETVLRNFWFCMIDDPSSLPMRHRIGVENIMVEVDYPHSDSIWPNTQELMRERFAGIERAEIDKMTHLNASRLFRHPVPRLNVVNPAEVDLAGR